MKVYDNHHTTIFYGNTWRTFSARIQFLLKLWESIPNLTLVRIKKRKAFAAPTTFDKLSALCFVTDPVVTYFKKYMSKPTVLSSILYW